MLQAIHGTEVDPKKKEEKKRSERSTADAPIPLGSQTRSGRTHFLFIKSLIDSIDPKLGHYIQCITAYLYNHHAPRDVPHGPSGYVHAYCSASARSRLVANTAQRYAAFNHDQSNDAEAEYDRLRDLARQEASKRGSCFQRVRLLFHNTSTSQC